MSAEDIRNGFSDAMDSDLAEAVYTASVLPNNGSYDVLTNKKTGATPFTGRGVLFDYKFEDDSENIFNADAKFVYLTSEFSSQIEIDNIITLTSPKLNTKAYKVVNVEVHPFEETAELHLSKS